MRCAIIINPNFVIPKLLKPEAVYLRCLKIYKQNLKLFATHCYLISTNVSNQFQHPKQGSKSGARMLTSSAKSVPGPTSRYPAKKHTTKKAPWGVNITNVRVSYKHIVVESGIPVGFVTMRCLTIPSLETS